MRYRHFVGRRDGGSLRLRLLALVLVPLVGAGMLTMTLLQQRHSSTQAAHTVQNAVHSALALDGARSALYQELLPELELVLLSDPAAAKAYGADAAIFAQLSIAKNLKTARAATDVALDQAGRVGAIHTVALTAQRELRAARVGLDSHKVTVFAAYAAAIGLANQLTVAENSQIDRATSAGLTKETALAVHNIGLVARGVEFAKQEPALFAASQTAAPANAAAARLAWLTSWGAFQSASTDIADHAEPAIRTAWRAMINGSAFTNFENVVSQSLVSAPPMNGATVAGVIAAQLLAAITDDRARDVALTAVLRLSADLTSAVAARQANTATRDFYLILALSLLLVVVAVGVALLAYRSLARPLNALSGQAKQVSEGELPEVGVAGPQEVRTVARGLAAAVASLRRIQDQAASVSAGALDDDIVRTPLPGPLGKVVHESVSTIIDAIRERDQAQRNLAHVASHDALTELPNRFEALALIKRALHRGQRAESTTGLMFLDLDRFKQVNDTFGHAAGDEVLKLAARRMLEVIRSGDTLARLGGDEFVILVEDVSSASDFVEFAERLIVALSAPMQLQGREVCIGASVGVAMCRDGYLDSGRLLHEADAAVYKAKREGRGRVGIFDDNLRRTLDERAELEEAISNALVEQQFVLHYQPVVDLASGRMLGLEALIRWERPGCGLLGPEEFIATAEFSSRINDIGRWVLSEATHQLAEWTASDPGASELTMAVNVSGRTLLSDTFPADVRAALSSSGIDPARLVVEVNETVLLDNPMAAVNMRLLREAGVKIAIDDFGTGYTSIGQLPRLPVDSLKIDRSFVASQDPAQQELVRLIVAAAHPFKLTVVAEGIEESRQLDSLLNAAAETGQGYLFSRPQPAASFNPADVRHLAGDTDRSVAL